MSSGGEVRGDNNEEESRMVREYIVPHSQPTVTGQHFREQCLQQRPGIVLMCVCVCVLVGGGGGGGVH